MVLLQLSVRPHHYPDLRYGVRPMESARTSVRRTGHFVACVPPAPKRIWASTPRTEPFAQLLHELTGAEIPAVGTVIILSADICDRLSRDIDLLNIDLFKIVAGTAA